MVKGAQTLTVTLASGDSYPAELVGGDEDNDVALLKIEGSGFATCKVGDSDTLRVGEMVAAIGNPLGELTNTLKLKRTVVYKNYKETIDKMYEE